MNESLQTLFMAQAIGLYLLFTSIIMLARAPYYQALLTHLKAGSSTVVLAGSIGMILGIIMVLVHNIWIMESEVLITLVSWIILIKSILWLAIPESMVKYAQKVYSGAGYYAVAGIAGIVGIILVIHGFYLFVH